jgi:hypothetical protein
MIPGLRRRNMKPHTLIMALREPDG